MEGNYDYYKLYLAAPTIKLDIKMLTASNTEPDHYPVVVLDVNGNVIGNASSKSNYIAIWNSIPGNTAIGQLSGGVGPFSFVLSLRPGQSVPSKLAGVPVHIFSGIFTNQFSSEFN